jgi:hypothetical protein
MTTRKTTAKAKGKDKYNSRSLRMTTRRGKAKGEDKVGAARRRAHADFSRVRREAV